MINSSTKINTILGPNETFYAIFHLSKSQIDAATLQPHAGLSNANHVSTDSSNRRNEINN